VEVPADAITSAHIRLGHQVADSLKAVGWMARTAKILKLCYPLGDEIRIKSG